MSNLLYIFLLSAVALGCQTIPDDAPPVFRATQEKLEQADRENVDRYLPTTMENSERQFDSALSDLKDARNEDPRNEVKEQQATRNAEIVGQNIDNATELTSQIRGWDKDIRQYAAFRDGREVDALVLVDGQPPVSEFEMQATLAYFPTAGVDVREADKERLENLAEMMKKNPTLRVDVIGFADPRGTDSYNLDLARKRAQSIATQLRDLGVDGARINEIAKGEAEAHSSPESGNLAEMQLDRRVDVNVTTYLTH